MNLSAVQQTGSELLAARSRPGTFGQRTSNASVKVSLKSKFMRSEPTPNSREERSSSPSSRIPRYTCKMQTVVDKIAGRQGGEVILVTLNRRFRIYGRGAAISRSARPDVFTIFRDKSATAKLSLPTFQQCREERGS